MFFSVKYCAMLLNGAIPDPLQIIMMGWDVIGILNTELETVNFKDYGFERKKLLVTPLGTIDTQSSINS